MLWSVDDGSDWVILRADCQSALNYESSGESYERFRERLVDHFELKDYVRLVSERIEAPNYFAPVSPIDLIFVDAGDTSAGGCVTLLAFYLPRVSSYSSIIIDKSSTMWDSFLLLENLVRSLNIGKIPASLMHGVDATDESRIRHLVATSTFTLSHFVDRNATKFHARQNGRCWIQIRPCDVVADPSVPTLGFNYH